MGLRATLRIGLLVGAIIAATIGVIGGPAVTPAGAASPTPVAVAASLQTCVLLDDGTLRCWGYNLNGQVGDGSQTNRLTPVAVPGVTGATAVATGGNHTCAIVGGGAVKCWGLNNWGQVGDGTLTQRLTPTNVTGVTGATQLALGFNHSCAVVAGGAVKCWGSNVDGELGDGAGGPSQSSATAVNVTGLTGVSKLSATGSHTCAVVSGGTVKCWGNNTYSQATGDGTKLDALTPATVPGVTGATGLGLGAFHTCVIGAGGSVQCWGLNFGGNLGDGTQVDRTAPTTVTGLTGVVELSGGLNPGGPNHTCARLSDGSVRCWGANPYGQIGDGTTTVRLTPTVVPAIAGATSLNAGLDYNCAIQDDDRVRCWGFNGAGRLGDGTSTTRLTPTDVVGYGSANTPGAPVVTAAKAGRGQATVTWSVPADGGSPITGYVVTPFLNGSVAQTAQVFDASTTTRTITGLTNGSFYSFKVAATNGVGTGPQSAASAVVQPKASHPFATTTALVDRVFLDMTKKAPTTAERAEWVGPIDAATKTRGDLQEALRRSPDNLTNVDPTARLYRAFLGRAPDAGGLNFWIGRRRAGTWSLTRMADSFASSNEFKTKYGTLTNRQFVTRIYTDVLGRTADQSGVNFWTNRLDRGAATRGGVMVGFSESNEYKRKQAENTDVAIAYIFLMGRAPTPAETTDWVTRQKAGTTNAALALELLNSDKYATRILG